MAGLDPAIGHPHQIANDAIPVSNHPMEMIGSSPFITGWIGASSTSTASAAGQPPRHRQQGAGRALRRPTAEGVENTDSRPPVMAGLDPAIGYPHQIANDAIPVSNHPMEMTGSSPFITGWLGASSTSTASAAGQPPGGRQQGAGRELRRPTAEGVENTDSRPPSWQGLTLPSPTGIKLRTLQSQSATIRWR